jgi:hypothetical protein
LQALEGATLTRTLPGIHICACLPQEAPAPVGGGNGGKNENAIIKTVITEHKSLGFVEQEEETNNFLLLPGSPQAPVLDLEATVYEDEDLDPDTDQTSEDDDDDQTMHQILHRSGRKWGKQCDLIPFKCLASKVCSHMGLSEEKLAIIKANRVLVQAGNNS